MKIYWIKIFLDLKLIRTTVIRMIAMIWSSWRILRSLRLDRATSQDPTKHEDDDIIEMPCNSMFAKEDFDFNSPVNNAICWFKYFNIKDHCGLIQKFRNHPNVLKFLQFLENLITYKRLFVGIFLVYPFKSYGLFSGSHFGAKLWNWIKLQDQ